MYFIRCLSLVLYFVSDDAKGRYKGWIFKKTFLEKFWFSNNEAKSRRFLQKIIEHRYETNFRWYAGKTTWIQNVNGCTNATRWSFNLVYRKIIGIADVSHKSDEHGVKFSPPAILSMKSRHFFYHCLFNSLLSSLITNSSLLNLWNVLRDKQFV
jgi:hypothetical protein